MRSREVRAHVCFSLAESRSVMSDSLQPHGLYSPHGLNSPGQNLGVGSLSLLLGIFLTAGIEPGSPALQAYSLPAWLQGSPGFNPWVGKIPRRRERLPTPVFLGFTYGSAGEESACNVRDLSSTPGLGGYRISSGPTVEGYWGRWGVHHTECC